MSESFDTMIEFELFDLEFSKYKPPLKDACELFSKIVDQTEDRVHLLHSFACIVEKLYDQFLQCDPDPFDNEVMSSVPENNEFRTLIMELRNHSAVMEKILFVDLLEEGRSEDLYSAAARVSMTVAPFLTLTPFVEREGAMSILFRHAKSEHVELQTYAVGLLTAVMNYIEYDGLENERVSLARVLLQRLSTISGSPDDVISVVSAAEEDESGASAIPCSSQTCQNGSTSSVSPQQPMDVSSAALEESTASCSEAQTYGNGNGVSDGDSKDGTRPQSYSLHPLTVDICHREILGFLGHQWGRALIIPYAVEANLVDRLYTYLDEGAGWNQWTVMNAIRCLVAMFSHPKVARVFVTNDGVHHLLRIKPDSLAGTGIPAALCQLAQQGEAMESICMMSDGAFRELIEYVVLVLECSHESARCDAVNFLAMCFGFRRSVEHFDGLHGLRAVSNNLGRLITAAVDDTLPDSNHCLAWSNVARYFAIALKRYLETHMLQKLEQLQQSYQGLWNRQPRRYPNLERTFVHEIGTIAEPQNLFSDWDFARECVVFFRENCSYCLDWYPIKELRRNDIIQLLLELADVCLVKLLPSSRQDCLSALLTVIWYASVSPLVQFDLSNTPVGEQRRNLFRREIIECSKLCWKEGPAKRLAICIIGNCVCGPLNKSCKLSDVLPNTSGSDERTTKLIKSIWKAVRNSEGIQVLVAPLELRWTRQDDDVDLLQICACDALIGLARCKPVRQIIEKLPLISENKILEIVKENERPSDRPKFLELHSMLLDLLEVATRWEAGGIKQWNPGQLYKQKVVAKTEVVVNRNELLVLIFRHLINNGLFETASQLLVESGFQPVHVDSNPSLNSKFSHAPTLPIQDADGSRAVVACSVGNREGGTFAPDGSPRQKVMRLSKDRESQLPLSDTFPPCSVTLESILKEHFRNQHAQCKKPVLACPPFSIFRDHKCPEFRARCEASSNFTVRIFERQHFPPYGGRRGFHKDLSFIYGRYRLLKSCEEYEGTCDYSTCSFTADSKSIVLGTYNGDVGWYDTDSDDVPPSLRFHTHPVSVARESQDRQLLLTATFSRSPRSVLWRREGNGFVHKFSMAGDRYAEFDGPKETRIVGSEDSTAKVYDIATGSLVVKLYDEELESNYSDNRATFRSCGNVVLSDGILWDVRTAKAIHKFDKLNDQVSGIFHPNDLDVVIDTAVWDYRTFRMRRTVDALHKHKVIFNSEGDVLFSILRKFNGVDWRGAKFDSYINVRNASDYSLIEQLPLKKLVIDIDVNPTDSYLATVEAKFSNASLAFEENACRIYSIGMAADSLQEHESDVSSETESIFGSEVYTVDGSEESEPDFETDSEEGSVITIDPRSESSRSSMSSDSEFSNASSTSTSD